MYLDNDMKMAEAVENYGKLDEETTTSLEMLDSGGSTPDISDCDRASPQQLTVCTMIGLDDDIKNIKDGVVLKVESLPPRTPLGSLHAGSENYSVMSKPKKENWCGVAAQIFIPFMIAGMGTIGAGLVLGSVERLPVFIHIPALYILVPSILGLKGNLDMCLASRMSTQANLGNMTTKKEIILMIIGNVGLVQVQAIVASCIVSLFANGVSAALTGVFDIRDAMLLAASSILTATVSCFILDFVLIFVIFLTQKLHMNPDNLATPLAASIGDVVSLMLLSTIASFLFTIHETYEWINWVILGIYLIGFLPFWILIVRKNKYTSAILTDGWVPVLSALFISGMGGLVLDSAVENFQGYVVFQPIINGIGGNLVSVQSSRISTMLHQTSIPGIIPPHTKQWVAPWTALFKGVYPAKTARLLISMSVPGQIVFVFLADLIYNDGISTVTPVFVLTYISVGLVQLMLLLYTAHLLTHTLWKFKKDPDNSTIPYLTALGDLLGSTFLLLGFMFLRYTGCEYSPI